MKRFKAILIVAILSTVILFPVNVQATSVKISKKKATMEVDSTLKLKITGTKTAVKWTTSKKTVATVSRDGIISAVREGQATITGIVNKIKNSCIVTVVNSQREEVTAKKGTIMELTTGLYIIGEDFPSGKYNVKALSGSGNFFVHGDDYIGEIMAEEGNETFDTHEYNNLRLNYGDEMKITNGVIMEFLKLD